jgi:hypothetical protein
MGPADGSLVSDLAGRSMLPIPHPDGDRKAGATLWSRRGCSAFDADREASVVTEQPVGQEETSRSSSTFG